MAHLNHPGAGGVGGDAIEPDATELQIHVDFKPEGSRRDGEMDFLHTAVKNRPFIFSRTGGFTPISLSVYANFFYINL